MPTAMQACLSHAAYHETVLRRAHDLYRQGGDPLLQGLALFDSDWENIRFGQAPCAVYVERDALAADLCEKYPHRGAHLLDFRQHPEEHLQWLETALTASRHSGNRLLESVHLGNMGLVYADLGRFHNARTCHEQALSISRSIHYRRGEAYDLMNLGLALADLGDVSRAIKCYDESLEVMREIGGQRGAGFC